MQLDIRMKYIYHFTCKFHFNFWLHLHSLPSNTTQEDDVFFQPIQCMAWFWAWGMDSRREIAICSKTVCTVRDLVHGGSEREQCQVAPEEAMRRGGSGISLFTGWEGRHRSRAEIESIWCMEWGIGEGQQRAGIETKCLSFCCRRTLCFPQHAWLIIESRTALACFCLATSPGKSQRSTRRQ